MVQTRFVTPWIMLLSPVPREDQEDATKMEEASPSPVFSRPPGFPRRVSSIQSLASLTPPPVPTGSLDWMTSAGPLRSVWILRRSSWTLATSPPLLRRTRSSTSPHHRRSRWWLACSVVLEDISKLLREVPSMQPRRRRTSESQEQPPELLGPKDAEIEVVLPTPLCQQPTPRSWLQADVLPSFGESEGPCLVAPSYQPARIMGYRTQWLHHPALW